MDWNRSPRPRHRACSVGIVHQPCLGPPDNAAEAPFHPQRLRRPSSVRLPPRCIFRPNQRQTPSPHRRPPPLSLSAKEPRPNFLPASSPTLSPKRSSNSLSYPPPSHPSDPSSAPFTQATPSTAEAQSGPVCAPPTALDRKIPTTDSKQ